jgi:hypothetical protein
VTFKVRLIYYPKTELVAEIVKARMGGIMRAAKSVYVMALHEQEILTDKRKGNRTAKKRMVIMPVYTTKKNRLAIN